MTSSLRVHRASERRAQVSLVAVAPAVALAAWALFTPNVVLTIACGVTLLISVALLWRPGEPQILAFAMAFQWLQIATKVIHANLADKKLSDFSVSPSVETAVTLSLLGICVTSVAIRLTLGAFVPPRVRRVVPLSLDHTFALYILTAMLSVVLVSNAWVYPALTQLFFAIGSLKWVAYYLLVDVTVSHGGKRAYLYVATLAEFVTGLGYFADFKTVFFIAFLAISSRSVRLTAKKVLIGLLLTAAVLMLGIVWTAIKEPYRNILNRGQRQQVVLVSWREQITTVGSLGAEVTPARMLEATQALFERIAYVDFFARAIDYVPAVVPHAHGTLLEKAITHVMLPRFLYPGKPALPNDSEITREYTGALVAGASEGTSIGIGYFAEAYVDFGFVGMFVPLFAFGLLWGVLYSFLVSRPVNRELALATVTAVFINLDQYEIATSKLIGGMLQRAIIFGALLTYIIPRVARWAETRGRERSAAGALPSRRRRVAR